MKVLESVPSRYDKGMQLVTFGRIIPLYRQLTGQIQTGDTVLDIGCGTGMITLLAAEAGAKVTGIDINPEMLDIARSRVSDAGLEESVVLMEKGIAELDAFQDSYDYIYAGMIFSELDEGEQDFTLSQINRLLAPDGKFIIIDESRPKNPILRILQWLVRIPLLIITYVITQTTTSSVNDLEAKLTAHRFRIVTSGYSMLSSLVHLVTEKEV